MILNFDAIDEQVIPNFKGGEKQLKTHLYADEACKIMRASLEPGASIGLHTHETAQDQSSLPAENGLQFFCTVSP